MTANPNMLWGYHPVREALRAHRRKIHTLYLAQERGSVRQEEIIAAAEPDGIKIEWMTPKQLTTLVGHRRHQGIAADVSGYSYGTVDQILVSAKRSGTPPFVLLLDLVVDPQNFGAVARTAHCAGIQGLIISKDRSASPTSAAIKASAGALEHMRLARVTNLVNAIKTLKDRGLWIVGADHQSHQNLFDADLKGPLGLVIGGEEKGLRPLVRKHCDFTVAIPQVGPLESLNASAAAAVIVYEAFRQRRAAGELNSVSS